MSRFKTLLLAAVWLILCDSSGAKEPNILIILADDVGVDALRIDPTKPDGQKVMARVAGENNAAGPVNLPCFEKLLKAGVHFNRAWAQPVCTPTRSSLWSGIQPWSNTLGFPNQGRFELPLYEIDKNELEKKDGEKGRKITSLAQAVAKSGTKYRQAFFGKWDLGEKPAHRTPVAWGWDEFAGLFRGDVRGDFREWYGFSTPNQTNFRLNWNMLSKAAQGETGIIEIDNQKVSLAKVNQQKCKNAAGALTKEYKDNLVFVTGNHDLRYYIYEKSIAGKGNNTVSTSTTLTPQERLEQNPPQPLYATADQIEDTKRFIKASGPWCVALNLIAPHDPYHIPPPGTYKVNISNPPTQQEMLVAMIESMDYYINDLLNSDEMKDQLANTVVIFVGDNGMQENDPDTRALPKRVYLDNVEGDDKNTKSEGGVHVPMIVADGGLMAGGKACYLGGKPRSVNHLVHIIDIYDTVLDIAKVAKADQPVNDSTSFATLLRNPDAGATRKYNFSQYYDLPDKNGITFGGATASATDSTYGYKLTCVLKTQRAQGQPGRQCVDRAGKPGPAMVWEYEFTKVVKSTEAVADVTYVGTKPNSTEKITGKDIDKIPGSNIEQKINALQAPEGNDGTFTFKEGTTQEHKDKIYELYGVLSKQRLTSGQFTDRPKTNPTPFPEIEKP